MIGKFGYYRTEFITSSLSSFKGRDEGERWRKRAIRSGVADEVGEMVRKKIRGEVTDLWVNDLLATDEDIHRRIEEEEEKAPTTSLYRLVDTSFIPEKEMGHRWDDALILPGRVVIAGVEVFPAFDLTIRLRNPKRDVFSVALSNDEKFNPFSGLRVSILKQIYLLTLKGENEEGKVIDRKDEDVYSFSITKFLRDDVFGSEVEEWKNGKKPSFLITGERKSASRKTPFKDIFSNDISPDSMTSLWPRVISSLPATSEVVRALLSEEEVKIRWKILWEPERGYLTFPLFVTPPY